MAVYQQNLYYTQKLQNWAQNNKRVKPQSYALGNEV